MKFDVRCVLMMSYIDLKTQRDDKYGFIMMNGRFELPNAPLEIGAEHVIRGLANRYLSVDYSFLQVERIGFYEDLPDETIYLLFRTRFPYFVKTHYLTWVSINDLKNQLITPQSINIIAQGMII